MRNATLLGGPQERARTAARSYVSAPLDVPLFTAVAALVGIGSGNGLLRVQRDRVRAARRHRLLLEASARLVGDRLGRCVRPLPARLPAPARHRAVPARRGRHRALARLRPARRTRRKRRAALDRHGWIEPATLGVCQARARDLPFRGAFNARRSHYVARARTRSALRARGYYGGARAQRTRHGNGEPADLCGLSRSSLPPERGWFTWSPSFWRRCRSRR